MASSNGFKSLTPNFKDIYAAKNITGEGSYKFGRLAKTIGSNPYKLKQLKHVSEHIDGGINKPTLPEIDYRDASDKAKEEFLSKLKNARKNK